jgi:ParB family transcriptional regulator, chromosome partitioning protein
LREIDENLVRTDLNLLERAEHLLRRKELYERLHPETRKGGNFDN